MNPAWSESWEQRNKSEENEEIRDPHLPSPFSPETQFYPSGLFSEMTATKTLKSRDADHENSFYGENN